MCSIKYTIIKMKAMNSNAIDIHLFVLFSSKLVAVSIVSEECMAANIISGHISSVDTSKKVYIDSSTLS